jgi:hypothetical protein
MMQNMVLTPKGKGKLHDSRCKEKVKVAIREKLNTEMKELVYWKEDGKTFMKGIRK